MALASTLISLAVSFVLLLASYFRWWTLTYDGDMRARLWVKLLWAASIVAVAVAAVLAIMAAIRPT